MAVEAEVELVVVLKEGLGPESTLDAKLEAGGRARQIGNGLYSRGLYQAALKRYDEAAGRFEVETSISTPFLKQSKEQRAIDKLVSGLHCNRAACLLKASVRACSFHLFM